MTNGRIVHVIVRFSRMHGYNTDELSFSTILPIPKGKNLNYSDSANCRGIALSSIIGKMTYINHHLFRTLGTCHVQT